MFSSCALIGTSIHNLNAYQIKLFNQLKKNQQHMFPYCVFFDDEIPCKQAKLSDTDLLVLDVIDDFELSVTVVNSLCFNPIAYII